MLTAKEWPQKVILDFFKVVYEFFWSYLCISIDFKRPTLSQLERLINDPKKNIFEKNFCSFWRFCESFLTILGVKKVVFWNISELFLSFLGNVMAFSLALKGHFWVYFHLDRSINDSECQDCISKICSFLPIWRFIFGHYVR